MSSANDNATTQLMANPAPASQEALGAEPAACEDWVNVAASSPSSKESEVKALQQLKASCNCWPVRLTQAARARLQIDDVGDLEDPSEDTVVQVRFVTELR